MKKIFFLFLLIVVGVANSNAIANPYPARSGMAETFESGVKNAYARACITLSSGVWELDNALIGASDQDKKDGSKSVRIKPLGKLTMLFNIPNGVTKISVHHAAYGSDDDGKWGMWYSTNNGTSWSHIAPDITSSSTFKATTFNVKITGDVRFEIRNLGGGRLNVDNIIIGDAEPSKVSDAPDTHKLTTRDDNLAFGNPSHALCNPATPDNFLVTKTQYTLSYNNSKGIANWVSWHLSSDWKGEAERCNCFIQDATLPSKFYKASTFDYVGTGFDRGHLCPSDDRDGSDTDNAATFRMTNIAPQAPGLNQHAWEQLESYCRKLAKAGNELYIIAGAYGTGGTGKNGGVTSSIGGGKINVPARFWKVVIVLPVGTNDVSRVTTTTRVIAVDMPNTQSAAAHPWYYYRTTTDAIEKATGYDVLSKLPVGIQSTIEAAVDKGAVE